MCLCQFGFVGKNLSVLLEILLVELLHSWKMM